jgi:RNA polymerase sigma-70 factor (ECF subfamily)
MASSSRREIHEAMVRFADGNRNAFREVFDALWPVLLRFSAGLLPDRADAEDAAQRALVKVFGQIMDMDRNRDGVAWALTIATYEVMTARRVVARRREEALDAAASIAADAPLADERMAQEQLRVAVRQVIGELSALDQEVLGLVLNEPQVAFGETMRKRRYRALQRFRALWTRAHG